MATIDEALQSQIWNIEEKHGKSKAQVKTIGIDKGYRCLIATSEKQFYWEKPDDFLSKGTERLNKVNAEQNRFWALKKNIEDSKISKIYELIFIEH